MVTTRQTQSRLADLDEIELHTEISFRPSAARLRTPIGAVSVAERRPRGRWSASATGRRSHSSLSEMSSPELKLRDVRLVGREPECGVIDGLLDGVSRGESGSLVVRAEAGMGKTALLRYATERAVGMTVLSVTGVEAESDLGFAGLYSLVRPIVDELPRVPAPQRQAVAAALGLTPAEGSDRFLVSAGVLSLLAAAAEERPVLCLIDDTHWLDVPSADSLVFTARRRRQSV
jgi:hypothetical protein